MAFDPSNIDLPINEVIDEIKSTLNKENTLIINAPPGAGKSTIVPIALYDEEWLVGKKILMLEPRRLAARTIAERMSSLMGESVGTTVGYRIRFDNKISQATRVEILTEGILTRMIHADQTLEDIGMVIFDEFHERSIYADVAMALCREVQQVLRPDLRIAVMSATLNTPHLKKLLNCQVIKSEGRQFPVDIKYTGEQEQSLMSELTSRAVIQAVKQHDGDTLVFLPGQGEIKKCEDILKKELRGFRIHPLYGQLPQHKQFAAIMPDRSGKRKVVLATSIAETSLTIEGIKIVIDSGFGRKSKFDPRSGLSRLHTVQISKDSADQRAGRAGRLSAGVCYRMWSKATDLRLEEHRTPEILEVDLSSLVLDLIQWGINDPDQLTWLTPPPKGTMEQARQTLIQLGAIQDGKITEHGQRMHALPCHPRIAHMLLMAEEHDQLALATDLAALLEERDPMPRDSGIDINLRVEVLRRQRSENRLGKRMGQIDRVAASYRQMFNIDPENGTFDPFESGVLIAYAYPERIACARPGNNAQFQLSNGRIAMAGHRDDLAHDPWLAVAHIDAREGMGKIHMAAPLNPKDLATMVKEVEVIKWNTEDGGLIATQDLRIGSIVLRSTPLPHPDESKRMQAIINAIKDEGEHLLDFNKGLENWQYRILSLKKWRPDEGWPDVSTISLLATNGTWLEPYLTDIKRPADLKKLDLKTVLQHSLDFTLQKSLDQLAPEKLSVPSGSMIDLQYQPDGSAPVMAVRLQELFGLAETPTVNEGRTPVLLHLLSPGFKPVQVTSDLNSFWNNTYYEVKKELKRRYPKHSWPDNPWEAEPIRGVHRPKNSKNS